MKSVLLRPKFSTSGIRAVFMFDLLGFYV